MSTSLAENPVSRGAYLRRIEKPFILPSAAYTLKPGQLKYYTTVEKKPEAGDVIFGRVLRIGQHASLENRFGRIHNIYNDSKAIFVFGNRYAPDYYEAFVPDSFQRQVDLVARSGLIGRVSTKNSFIKDPTKVAIFGYVCDAEGRLLSTLDYPMISPRRHDKTLPRSKMILVCGTTMNSGKSVAAASCCWILSSRRQTVKCSKITGTASLKDILHMNDAGASSYSDFTFFGYPSTYMIDREGVIGIFNKLDLKYANNPKNYWVVEIADGVNQRETALLLASSEVQSRIHRLILCANDAFSAMGGIEYLRSRFSLAPDLISGICTSSPLHVRELRTVTSVPIFHSMEPCPTDIAEILL